MSKCGYKTKIQRRGYYISYNKAYIKDNTLSRYNYKMH